MVDQVFALGLLAVVAVAGGAVAKRLGLPPLLGMLVAGLGIGNLAGGLLDALPGSWSLALRLTALTIILLRAGLGLNLEALQRLRMPFLRLAFLPNLAEASVVAVAASMLLGLPLIWAVLLGFVVAAVSPAVVVPSLLDLQSNRFGTKKGIPTMVLAAASFDDVLSITGFGIALSLIFGGQADASLTVSLLRAPIEVLAGLGAGVVGGYVCIVLCRNLDWLRLGFLTSAGFLAVFGGWAIGYAGAGSLAAMTMAAVAARSWGATKAHTAEMLGYGWTAAQPFLFGLIGAAVLVSDIETSYASFGLVVLALGIAVRLAVSYLSVGGKEFVQRERLFVALAWLPKATVQAALGALALDLAKTNDSGSQIVEYGTIVLTISVLAILVSAPAGALVIAWAGPRWLDQETTETPG